MPISSLTVLNIDESFFVIDIEPTTMSEHPVGYLVKAQIDISTPCVIGLYIRGVAHELSIDIMHLFDRCLIYLQIAYISRISNVFEHGDSK